MYMMHHRFLVLFVVSGRSRFIDDALISALVVFICESYGKVGLFR